jgi:hypothetical protein
MSQTAPFKKNLLKIFCVLIFSTTFVSNICHSKKTSARYYDKCTQVFAQNTRYYCPTLVKLELRRKSFEKYPNVKFTKIRPLEAQLFHADRQEKANICFSQFCERA